MGRMNLHGHQTSQLGVSSVAALLRVRTLQAVFGTRVASFYPSALAAASTAPIRFNLGPWLVMCLLLAHLTTDVAQAQIPPPPPACGTGTAFAWLEGREVRAPIYNTGSLFARDAESPLAYRDEEGRPILFAASLWIGAQFDGFLSMAASMLEPSEFWPGPLDENGLSPAYCSPYDRIFAVGKDDILEYDRAGVVTDNLRDWPAWAGAPVVDGDGIPDNYNLAAGDRPALLGDRMLWWVMNDRGGNHAASEAMPIQVQVETTAFAYDVPGVLGRSTFYRYRIKRMGIFPFIQAHVGLFVRAGLGNQQDDYVGADTSLSMGFVYNADNFDEGAFGPSPPAVGVGILRGSGPDLSDDSNPRALDTRRMTSFLGYKDLCDLCDPFPGGPGVGFYNMMQGRWPWGTPVTFGGRGQDQGGEQSKFMYTGEPGEHWSEANIDGSGQGSTPGFRKMVLSTGPYTLVPGAESEVVFAIVTSHGADHFDSVRQLKEDMAFVRSRTTEILAPIGPGQPVVFPVSTTLVISEPWPNPSSDRAHLQLSLPTAMDTSVEVFDLLGRRVQLVTSGLLEEGGHLVEINTAQLAPGIYAYRVHTGRFLTSGTLVVGR
jgi:Secretion system C-terminal sorting domain